MILHWGSELGYLGLQPLVRPWGTSAGAAAVPPVTARGNIDSDQIRASARTGNGDKLHVWQSPVPGGSGAFGTPGQLAYDTDYLYICMTDGSWKRVALSSF